MRGACCPWQMYQFKLHSAIPSRTRLNTAQQKQKMEAFAASGNQAGIVDPQDEILDEETRQLLVCDAAEQSLPRLEPR